MKYLLLSTFLIFFISCGKKAEDLNLNPIAPTSLGGTFPDDNVSTWEASKTVDLTTYYTSIDTVNSPAFIKQSISAIYPEGDSVRFAWSATTLPAATKNEKAWLQTEQKWVASSTLTLDPGLKANTFNLTASVTFLKANKPVLRNMALNLKRQNLFVDVYGVNFGMSRDEVKTNEIKRIGPDNIWLGGWVEHSPTIAELNNNLVYGNFTLYEFANNQLKSINVTSSTGGVDGYLEATSRKLKSPYTIPIGPLTRDYTWNNGKLKFTIQNKEFQLSTGSKKLVCLTYEKLQ